MVEVSLRSTAAPLKISPLTRVASVVQPHLDEVSARIARQTEAFDPAIEGYITYALESGGKRLRPLVALLAGAATGAVSNAHIVPAKLSVRHNMTPVMNWPAVPKQTMTVSAKLSKLHTASAMGYSGFPHTRFTMYNSIYV
jgi:geranylgeranyl pyrophosphate synthase